MRGALADRRGITLCALALAGSLMFFAARRPIQDEGALNMDELLAADKAGVREGNTASNSPFLDRLLSDIHSWNFSFVGSPADEAGRTIRVPEDVVSIQAAIEEAESGDTVRVSAGEYKESLIMSDGVSVVGDSADTVILDANRQGNGVTFKDILDRSTRLEGFTIKNAGPALSGVLIENSSPIINRNIIQDNDYDIYIKGESAPTIQRNRLSASKAGVQLLNLDKIPAARAVILDNVIFANRKGINAYKGSAFIEHNTVSFNSMSGADGASYGVYLHGSSAEIRNNIITDNGICDLCGGIYADSTSADVKLEANDIWNNQNNYVCFGKCETGENFSEDPRFTDYLKYDLSLKADSPYRGSSAGVGRLGTRL